MVEHCSLTTLSEGLYLNRFCRTIERNASNIFLPVEEFTWTAGANQRDECVPRDSPEYELVISEKRCTFMAQCGSIDQLRIYNFS